MRNPSLHPGAHTTFRAAALAVTAGMLLSWAAAAPRSAPTPTVTVTTAPSPVKAAPTAPIHDALPANLKMQYHGTVPLAQLTAGAVGHGTLLYTHVPSGEVRLAVQLDHKQGGNATARVYDTSTLNGPSVPATVTGDTVTLPATLKPALVMTAHGGWWVRNERPNYALDVHVYGQAYAMWGQAYDPARGPIGSGARIRPGEAAVDVRVRPDASGLPGWDDRRLLPDFGTSGYVRYNYAERKCVTPTTLNLGVTPEWPFLAAQAAYEQPVGQLRGPVGVDWTRGRVTHFAELVAVRNQNCAYALYSLNAVRNGRNLTDFESPFAFYDLSGQGDGHPNMILRTERYFPLDRYSTGVDARLKGNTIPQDFQTVRYSWRNAPGDQRWNYKIEVQGSAPYTGTNRVAGGTVTVDTPTYEAYPAWVTDRAWPVVTFVATESERLTPKSSEGIYTYSPRELGLPYLLGTTATADPGAFGHIPDGFRGEYRYTTTSRPQLYLGSVDGRVHLLHAEGGAWPVTQGQQLQVHAIAGSAYVNHWRLQDRGERVQELARLGSTVLLLSDGKLSVTRTSAPQARWTGTPPTDAASWRAFRAVTGDRIDQPAPDLQAWFTGQANASTARQVRTYLGVQVGELHALPDGAQFDLTVRDDRRASGALTVPALDTLNPGRYTVTVTPAGWTVTAQTPPRLEGEASASGLTLNTPGWLNVTLRNTGSQVWSGPATLRVNGTSVHEWPSLEVPGRAERTYRIAWTPTRAGQSAVMLHAGTRDLQLGTADLPPGDARLTDPAALFQGARRPGLTVLLLTVLLALASVAGWRVWSRA